MPAEKFRPRRDWCSVLNDERQEVISGGLLYLPNAQTTPEKLSQGTGTVIRVGTGKAQTLLKVGDRVAYRGHLVYANPVEDGGKWDSGAPKMYFAIAVDDVIGIISEGVSVGVFSSPASHAVKKGK